MRIRPYATRPAHLGRQLIGDVAVVTWAAGWLWAAFWLHDTITTIGSAGFRLRDGAGGVATSLHDAGDDAARLPLAGETLATPLRSAGGAATTVADAGRHLGDAVTGAALPLALLLVAMTVLPVAIPWVLARSRYARLAGVAMHLAGTPAGRRMLALRALATAPVGRLHAVDVDAVDAWLRQDDEVIVALAAVELRRFGLRPK